MQKKLVKTILLAIPSLEAGGMERVMAILANYLEKDKSIDLHLILYGRNRGVFYKLPESINVYIPRFKFNNKYRALFTLKTILFIRKKIVYLKPDVILNFGEYWNNLMLIATFGLRFPIFISDRSEPLRNLGRFQNYLRKILYPRATGLILQTHKAKEIYQKQFKKLKIEVIGNPIRKVDNPKKIKKENIILMVGRLIKTKNQAKLISIFAAINNPKWKLVLVGGDSKQQQNKRKLLKLIDDLELGTQVELAGQQPDVGNYYLKSKIFAFTSSSEGFPNVIGEAMSAGLPVVSYDCLAGPSEIIEHKKNGFLVPLFDDIQFKKRLMQMMEDDDLRQSMGDDARRSIKKFDIDLISEKFLETII